MLSELRGRVDELSDNFNEGKKYIKMEIENIKKTQSEMKSTITEMKNTLEGINSRWNEAEVQISDLEDKVAETTQSEQQQEKKIQKNDTLGLWDNIKPTDILIGIPEEEEREWGIENLF